MNQALDFGGYDASRLHPEDVRALLRSAGLDTDDVAEAVFDAG
jgi:hypothetical protein